MVTIIAILAAAIPAVTAGIPAMRLRAEAARLSETMRQAHDDAIRQGIDMEIVFDPAALRYVVLPANAARDMAPAVDRLELAVDAVMHAEHTMRVRFFGDGSATGAMVRLWHGKRSNAITVDWLTGRVVEHD